jgi:hypothetical protein
MIVSFGMKKHQPGSTFGSGSGERYYEPILAQFFSNHQGLEPIEPDRRCSDGKRSDWTSSINVQ